MSYRDVQTAVGAGTNFLSTVSSIPGLGAIAGLVNDVIGAFSTASEQEAYNAMIWRYYATPVSQGGGYNPGTPASRRQMRLRQLRHFSTYFH